MEFSDLGALMNKNETQDKYVYNKNILNYFWNGLFF